MFQLTTKSDHPLRRFDVRVQCAPQIIIKLNSGRRVENDGNIIDQHLQISRRQSQIRQQNVSAKSDQLGAQNFRPLSTKCFKYLPKMRQNERIFQYFNTKQKSLNVRHCL